MFTGIVQALGIINRISDTPAGKRLSISLSELASVNIAIGDSVCVSGVCLTLVKSANGTGHFDVITETLRRSTLGEMQVSDRVNLELSLQPQSYVGGHFVQGHVDAVGIVRQIQNTAEDFRITVEVPPEHMTAIVPKGSVTVDGVSLTLAEVKGNTFTVAIIPTTLDKTTLSSLAAGSKVNVETDILARTVVHWLEQTTGKGAGQSGGITLKKLMEAGFA